MIELQDLSWATCFLTDYVYESLNALGVLLTLIFSIDRMYAVLRPIKIKMFITYRYPRSLAAITYIGVLLIKSLELFLNQPKYNSK